MSNAAGTLTVPGGRSQGNLTRTLAVNQRWNNEEQTCDSGYTGTPIPAGTYTADTQAAANALAAADLVCVPDGFVPPTINGYIEDVGIQSDGKMVIVGSFTSVGGVTMKSVARLNVDGTRDTSVVNLNPTNIVDSIVVRDTDKVVVGGYFNSIASTARGGVAGLNADLTLDSSFGNPALSISNIYLSLRSDGKIYAIGDIVGELKRINTDGSVDGAFAMSGLTALGYEVCAHTGYGVLVDGYDGPTYGVFRLTDTGSVDGSFTSQACNGEIWTIVAQSDGKILVGGAWSTLGGSTDYDDLVRLQVNGTIDTGFAPPAFAHDASYPIIKAVAVQGDGKILVAGTFDEVNATSMTNLVRLNSDGSVDGSWPDLAIDNDVLCVKVRGDGKIVIAGLFSSVGGESMSKIAVLNSDGTLAN